MIRPDQKASGGSANVGGDVGRDVNIGYTPDQHEAALQRRLDDLRADLDAKHAAMAKAGAAKQKLLRRSLRQLQQEKTEVERRMGDLGHSYREAVVKIADLEALLACEGNQIGADRLAEARAALERGDFSKADNLFAEIEAREAMAVQSAARAAFARGEIAEEQVRWADAAEHYTRAAGHDPSFRNLERAAQYAWRSGAFTNAEYLARRLLSSARDADSVEKESFALNSLAILLNSLGRYAEAEPLFRQALEIDEKTIGTAHPDHATRLNNLAGLLRAMGRYAEAEPLFRQALEIDEKTIGTAHPGHATHLNNLAGLLRAMGRYAEAEPLFRQALEIDEKTIGTAHPGYATHLNNLAGLLLAMGRYPEAEPLYRQALEIGARTIGTAHPDYAIHLSNLAALLRAMGRHAEAEPLYRQALEIGEKTIGTAHPDYATRLNNLAGLLRAMGRYPEAEPLYVQALAILRAKLGPDHPNTKTVEENYAAFLKSRGGGG